jgi:hypothetical protein
MTGCDMLDFGKPARKNGKRLPCQRMMAENYKLRQMVRSVLVLRDDSAYKWLDATFIEFFGKSFTEQARELGLEDTELD